MTTADIERLAITRGLSYADYRQLIDRLLKEGRTTGPDQSEKMISYARLNQQRMLRLEKQGGLSDALRAAVLGINVDQIWVALTEGWCGDAAQNLPVIAQAAAANPRITFRLLLRDDNPEVMDRYLFNGTRSIPRVMIFRSGVELAVWGPRPGPAQEIVNEGKRLQRPHEEWSQEMHAWYARDKTQTLQREWVNLIQRIHE